LPHGPLVAIANHLSKVNKGVASSSALAPALFKEEAGKNREHMLTLSIPLIILYQYAIAPSNE